MTEPTTAVWTMLATRVLAPNPGHMTLEGTNTYIVRRPGLRSAVVVDPGPTHPSHLAGILSHGEVELILLTHHHKDHSESAMRLSAMTGAPVRAADESHCIAAAPLLHEETIFAAGTLFRVIHTPGHTRDSISLYLPDDRYIQAHYSRNGSMITGDTILGRGTSVIAYPDGSLGSYISTLTSLSSFESTIVLPGHGPNLDNLGQVAKGYIESRKRRLKEIESAVRLLEVKNEPVTISAVTDRVYVEVGPELRFAAEMSVRAHLEFIYEETGDSSFRVPSH